MAYPSAKELHGAELEAVLLLSGAMEGELHFVGPHGHVHTELLVVLSLGAISVLGIVHLDVAVFGVEVGHVSHAVVGSYFPHHGVSLWEVIASFEGITTEEDGSREGEFNTSLSRYEGAAPLSLVLDEEALRTFIISMITSLDMAMFRSNLVANHLAVDILVVPLAM